MDGYRGYHRYLVRQLTFAAKLMLCTSFLGMLASLLDVFFRSGWNLGSSGLALFTMIFVLAAALFQIVSYIQRNYISER